MDEKKEMSDLMVKRIMSYNLPVIVILMIALILCVKWIPDTALIAIISTAIGGVINAMMSERLQLLGFFFGSSEGSKKKTEIIEKLQEGKDEA